MNIFLTLIVMFATVVVIGGIAIFIMNLASSLVFYFMDNGRTDLSPRYIFGLGVLTLIHVYIFLGFISIIVLLVYKSSADYMLAKSILWIVASIFCVIPAWTAYVQAKNKLNDVDVKKYESMHTNALALNAFISSIGFLILAFFPTIISVVWPYLEHLLNKFL